MLISLNILMQRGNLPSPYSKRSQKESDMQGGASMLAALVSTTATMCVSPPFFRVFGVSFHPPGFLLRLLSCCPALPQLCTLLDFFFFFLVSFLWFWVSLSSFLLLSPLLEPSLLFFLLSVKSLLGAVAVTPPKKKKKKTTRHRHCRAKLRVYRDDHPSRPLPIHKNYRVS